MRLSYRIRFRRDHGWAPAHMSEYVDGELAPAELVRMDRHTRECPECDRLLAGLRAVVERLGRLGAPSGGIDAVQVAAAVQGRLGEPPHPG
jgi:anti-sigma factor RsiW